MTRSWQPPELTGDASVAAFPLGGIGTGNVSLGARGDLRDWEIFNGPGKGDYLPYTFFALRCATVGKEPVTRVLESRLRPPHQRSHGYNSGDLAGLPRLRESRMRGEYPLVWVDFEDDTLPVTVGLHAFTPLVPLDAAESGLPVVVLRYTVRNTSDTPVDVSVVGSLINAVGFTGYHRFFELKCDGEPRNEFRDDGTVRGLHYGSSLPDDHLRHGTMALTTTDGSVTVKEEWRTGYWWDGMHDFWDDLCADGRLERPGAERPDGPPQRSGSLGIVHTLKPGRERDFEFVLSWHFPNRPRGWIGHVIGQDPNAHEIVRNFYATRHDDAWAVAAHLHANLPRLERDTRAFHDSLHHGTLPAQVVDAMAATLAAARSTTCFRLADGTFLGWEGTFDHDGSCEGSCTHVWNYAQSVAFLFPELERTMREVEFLLETEHDGRMEFRTNRVFGGPPWGVHPAVDGQLGCVVRLYREWRFSGDDAFLTRLWPAAVRALEYAFTAWDTDGDFVLDGEQHNTYDINFHGPNPLSNSMFYAALRAAAELADHLGESDRATRYRDAAGRGAAAMDAMLWNGEYYVQLLDDVDAHPYQYGTGCLSDQVFGQLCAHVVGLGHVLPREHVSAAIAAVYRHNFRPDLSEHHNVQRTYALGDEGGLLLCSWPNGGRPKLPFVYCDEVWTGIEYQVAAHLVYEGHLDEALTLVATVRDRHDGHRRNPWNEVECGNHYARSMASWGLLLALSGVQYDAHRMSIGFAPAVPELRCFFSTGTGWGTVTIHSGGIDLLLRYGSLRLASVTLPPRSGQPSTVDDEPVTVSFEPVSLAVGEKLTVEYPR